MEALRLIKTARHALAETRNVPDVLAEARQAALLTEAVATRLVRSGEEGLSGLGQLLAEAATHAACCLEHPEEGAAAASAFGPGGRARRLTELGEFGPMLDELGRLLRDMGETLVVLACGADTESLYWACIDGVDAGAECTQLVDQLLDAVRRTAGERPEEYDAEPCGAAEGGPGEPFGPDGARRLPGPATEHEERLLVLRLDPPGQRAAESPPPAPSAEPVAAGEVVRAPMA
ncbi:DUF6099 family protein [Kitasatospora purpeofusca]|uniref:DUF6099 family protein n=1 Tax=Kitasatospora purpeofusca TaxID=67352 RepID=UPI003867F14A|nr:DUF6099 family protein [Kitasatospora purpeofusca]